MTDAARLEVGIDSRPAVAGATAATRILDALKGAARGAQAEIERLSASGGKVGGAATGAGVAAKEIQNLASAAKSGEASMGGLSGAIKRAANDNTLLGAAARGLIQGLRDAATESDKARDSLGRYAAANDNADNSLVRLGGRLRLLPGLVLSAAAAFGFKQITDTITEFQSLQVRLEVATGSITGAGQAFSVLSSLAAKTPFSVADLTTAFIDLKNLGLDPSQAALISYGNTAGATGKTLDQFIQAVADAATGQFERLKEFGIKASAEGDKVAFTFKGATTSVANDAASIEQYLQNIGNTDFAGGMDKQSQTLGGAFSNLGDATATLASKFGAGGFSDAVLQAVTSMSAAEAASGDLASELGGLAGDAISTGVSAAKSFSNIADDAADAVREVRITFAGLAVLKDAFDPLYNGAMAVFDALGIRTVTFAESVQATLKELDALSAFSVDYLGAGLIGGKKTNFAGGAEDLMAAKRKQIQDAKEARDLDMLIAQQQAATSNGDPLAKYRIKTDPNAPKPGDAAKAASEAKKAANEAERATKAYEKSLADLGTTASKTGQLIADMAAKNSTAGDLFKNAGFKIARGENGDFEGQLRQQDRQDSGIADLVKEAESRLPDIGKQTGKSMADAFGDQSLQLAAGIGELIGGKAGNSLGGVIRALNTPGGALSGQALGGQLGGAYNALNALTGGGTDPSKPSALSKGFSESLGKTFEPFKSVLGKLGGGLDKIFGGEGKFGEAAGKGLAGAAVGGVVNSVIGGSGNAKIGGQIGGAIGGLTGIPGGAIIGAVAGNLLGSLVKGVTPRAFQNLNTDSNGNVVQSFGGARGKGLEQSGQDAKAIASSFSENLSSLLDQLGGKLAANATIGAIGPANGKFEFKTGNTSTQGYGGGYTQVFDTAEEAIAAGIKSTIERGLVTGIRAGTRNLLTAAGDFETQLGKATKFENVFTELKQRVDPVGAAMDDLNKQLTDLRGIFKEAGASADDYAKLEQLFQLKRQDALEQGNAASLKTMQDYLAQLKGSSNYGLSASTRYANSQASLAQLDASRASGGAVDFEKYQSTADAFLQASRDLNGSTTSYFRDLANVTDAVQAMTDKAQTEADKAAAAAAPVVDAVTAASAANVASLDAVKAAIEKLGGSAANTNTVSGGIGAALARYTLNF